MNLKKTVVSLFAATAITMSLASPAAFADEASIKSTVNEGGDFTYNFDAEHTLAFPGVSVDTRAGASQVQDIGAITFDDYHAYSNGFALQLSATPFTHTDASGSYSIPNTSLSVRERHPTRDNCALNDTNVVTNGNVFQVIDGFEGDQALGGSVQIISGTEGRGCGLADFGIIYLFTAPAGTYTAGGSAVYTANMTLSQMPDVGEGDEGQ